MEQRTAFLFTDIQDSTRLWDRRPREMRLALARHDDIVRHAIESSGGEVFRTVGDAFCAAFDAAGAALVAAVQGQRALHAEQWPASMALRVRMALHVGEAEPRRGDYVGACLNRLARLLATAHGGQTLLSRTAREQVGSALPIGIQLRDLGEHRLRDLREPEQVFEIVACGLPSHFTSLRRHGCRPCRTSGVELAGAGVPE